MSNKEIEFQAIIRKHRRINIPRALVQVRVGDTVMVRMVKVDE